MLRSAPAVLSSASSSSSSFLLLKCNLTQLSVLNVSRIIKSLSHVSIGRKTNKKN